MTPSAENPSFAFANPLLDWSEIRELFLNPSKSEHLPVGDTSNHIICSFTSLTSSNAQPIQTVSTIRHPGILLNQLIFIGLRSSKGYYKWPGGGVGIWEGLLGCEFLRGSMCAEGMGCGRRWVRRVLRGTGTASGHPGVPSKMSPTMR